MLTLFSLPVTEYGGISIDFAGSEGIEKICGEFIGMI